jgi:hypothetical protein
MFQDHIENIPEICNFNNNEYFQKFDCKNVTAQVEGSLFNTFNQSKYLFQKVLDID